MKKKRPHAFGEAMGAGPPDARRRTWLAAGALFLLAFFLRLLFWKTTPDAWWPYSGLYRGDALVWLQYATAIKNGVPYEAGLPMRPPGAGYMLAAIWDGTLPGILGLKLIWCLLGAATVVLVQRAASRSFGAAVGWIAGIAAAGSTGLLILSTSLNNETPYLLLAVATIALCETVRSKPSIPLLATWSVLNAIACLIRVEHVVFFLPTLAWIAIPWRPRLLPVALALLFFAIPLLPWQIRIHDEIRRFNEIVRPNDAGLEPSERLVEDEIRGMAWEADALRERERLPGFVRRLGADFVASTVRHRGGERVTATDFGILEEAFGYRPEPIGSWPFVTAYGPLNFFLANNPQADGGFHRFALDNPPPLEGGRDRYPPDLLLDPARPGMLFLDYPPHLRAFNHGTRLGWNWVRAHPGGFLGLAARKLSIFGAGAALGFGGHGFPIGISGVQRSVDITVPKASGPVVAWRLAVLAVCMLGLHAARTRREVLPWLIFLAGKIGITLLFFGYARVGATASPVVFVLAALAVDRWVLPRVRWNRLAVGVAVALLLLVADGLRFASRPALRIDGRTVVTTDPFPGELHLDRTVEIR